MTCNRKANRKNHNKYWAHVALESGTVLGLVEKSDYKVIITVNPVVNEIANDMRSVGKDICKAYDKLRGQSVGADYRKVISKDAKPRETIQHSAASRCVAEENFDRYASLYRATKAY